MYRVTMHLGPTEHVSLRVANQDLARLLILAGRLKLLNPTFEITYADESRLAATGAA